MRPVLVVVAIVLHLLPFIEVGRGTVGKRARLTTRNKVPDSQNAVAKGAIAPKVIIITQYVRKGLAWLNKPSHNLYANNKTGPGLSPLFPDTHWETNAAASLMALTFSPLFNLTRTYFIISGNGGINPSCRTLGSVAFSRFAVQVALQYGIDPRELCSNYTTGYIRKASTLPNSTLSTSMGNPLREAFTNFTLLVTSGAGKYCLTAQEDNGTLEALLHTDLAEGVEFSRVLIMRVGSNFDSPPPGVSAEENLLYIDPRRRSWENMYKAGIQAENYIGDILDSLKWAVAPDFGAPKLTLIQATS
ncbi:MAG: hypothetical protein MMC23_002250 [Stictis urceolatum]|nr:hypothetical protein [Stictis urceolata]